MILKFCLTTLITAVIITIAQYPLRRKHSAGVNIACAAAKFILAGMASMAAIGVNAQFTWTFHNPLVAFNIACIADVAADIIRLIMWLFRRGKSTRMAFLRSAFVTIVCTAAYLLFGVFNYSHTVVNEYTVASDKVSRSYKVAFISDIHYGHPCDADMLTRAVELINKSRPDFVILGGDITDDYSTYGQMQEVYDILSGIESDTYFIYGNHDRQPDADLANGPQYTEADLVRTIEASDITILRDAAARISDEFVLIGREDVTMEDLRTPARELSSYPDDMFVLAASHSPYDNDDILALRADVLLGGHTHSSQTFPNHPVYIMMGLLTSGSYDIGTTETIVSCGMGTWAAPFRSEGHSEVTVVTIEPGR